MDIANRKEKKYSEKLFGELCFIYLLMNGEGFAPFYLLRSKLNVSDRTLYRYAKELHDARLTPKLYKLIHNDCEYFVVGRDEYEDPEQKYLVDLDSSWGHYEFEDFLVKYQENNIIPEEKQDRLYRCGRMVAKNYEAMAPIESVCDIYLDEDGNEVSTIPASEQIYIYDGDEYVIAFDDNCDELYKNKSLRTQQRDISLVQVVIAYMYEG